MIALLWLAALAPQAGDAGDEAAQAALKKLSERFRDVRTLSAKVTQTRRTDLLEKPITSSGKMYYRRSPARLVFHLTEPATTEIHLDRASYQVHRPSEKRLERFDFEGEEGPSRLLMIFEPKPEEIAKAFRVRAGATRDGRIEVLLDPAEEKVRLRLKKLTLTVTEADGALHRISYTDGEGDEVTFDLSDVAINPEIAPTVFELKLPEGTRILRHTLKTGK